jgi:hypothetical protein
MPNWCSNYLVVTGSADAIRQINEGFQKENAFKNLIGKDPSFAEDNWYDHNCSRYGTKWDIEAIDTSYEDGDTELALSFDTAWSPCVPFVKTLCEKYRTNAVLEYSECGFDFAGRVTLEWEGKEGREILCVHKEQWEYHEGVYTMDSDQWMESELEWQIDFAKTNEMSAEDFVNQFPFLSEEDRLQAIEAYNE